MLAFGDGSHCMDSSLLFLYTVVQSNEVQSPGSVEQWIRLHGKSRTLSVGTGCIYPTYRRFLPTQYFVHKVYAKGLVLETGLQSPLFCAGIFKQSMRVRNRVGIVFSYRPARYTDMAELVP